jgi:hypothetical protein
MPGKYVPERRSGSRPSEKELPQRRSGAKIPLVMTEQNTSSSSLHFIWSPDHRNNFWRSVENKLQVRYCQVTIYCDAMSWRLRAIITPFGCFL